MQPGTHNGVIHTPVNAGFPAYINHTYGSRLARLSPEQINSLAERGFSAGSNGYVLKEGDI
jgi:hypothetical protein